VTIIFSKNSTSWGSFSYDEKEDALRVTTKPQAAESFEVSDVRIRRRQTGFSGGHTALGKARVPIHIGVDVKAVVLRSIKHELRSVGGFTWAGFDEAAQWCLDNNYNLEEALKWEETFHSE